MNPGCSAEVAMSVLHRVGAGRQPSPPPPPAMTETSTLNVTAESRTRIGCSSGQHRGPAGPPIGRAANPSPVPADGETLERPHKRSSGPAPRPALQRLSHAATLAVLCWHSPDRRRTHTVSRTADAIAPPATELRASDPASADVLGPSARRRRCGGRATVGRPAGLRADPRPSPCRRHRPRPPASRRW